MGSILVTTSSFFVRIKEVILKMFGAYTLESVVVLWLALSARGHGFNSSKSRFFSR